MRDKWMRSTGGGVAWILSCVFALLGAACGGGDHTGRPDGAPPGGDASVPVPDANPGVDSGPRIDAGLRPDTGGGMDSGVGGMDPTGPGPFTVGMASDTVTRGSRSIPVTARFPMGAGSHPVVILLPGFQLQSSYYAPLAERLASHGLYVVSADPPGSLLMVSHVAMRDDVIEGVLPWVAGQSGADATRIGIAGHSLGGKVSAMVAAGSAEIDALLGIDPVNGGAGPIGYNDDAPDIVPSPVSGITVPVGFMGETTNGSGGFMPCAPLDQNFQTFYEATGSAAWAAEWDFTGADHMDFVHDTSSCGFTCTACPDGSADEGAVLAGMSTLAVAFMRQHLMGEAMEEWLTGGRVPSGVVTRSR